MPTNLNDGQHKFLREAAVDAITFRISGDCMMPSHVDGSRVQVARCSVYWPGDVIVFRSADGLLISHRLLGCYRRAGQWRLLTAADNAKKPDRYVLPEQVVGSIRCPAPRLSQRAGCLLRFFRFALARAFRIG